MKNAIQVHHLRSRKHALIAALAGLIPFISGLEAATLTHNSGTTTYSQNFGNNSLITVNGGQATFTGRVRSKSTIDAFGGTAIFNGRLDNKVTFNIAGGDVVVNSVKNNATFDVASGSISLNESIGNSASVNISGGEMNLGTDDVFANNTDVTMSGGTLDTQGNSVSFDSLTLNGDSTIDLGNNPNSTIDVGTITGGGTVTFTGFTNTTQVSFNEGSSTVDVGNQVFFGSTPATINEDGNIVPVPEPTTIIGGLVLVGFLAGFEIRRRTRREAA